MKNRAESWWRFFFILLPSSFILVLSGCAIIGVAAHALPPETVKPKYAGLAGQSIGVMVWADRGIRIDWQNLQLDLASAIQKKLAESKAKVLVGAKFPVSPASIVRYQMDHPQVEAQHITEVAPALGVSRLIYLELDDFATRSDMSVDLFRGQAKGTVRLIEIEYGVAKVAFEQANVQAFFPPKAPREGIPSAGDARIYVSTVDAFATEVAHLFIPYQPEE